MVPVDVLGAREESYVELSDESYRRESDPSGIAVYCKLRYLHDQYR